MRQWQEMSMGIVVVKQKISHAMKADAEKKHLQPGGTHPICDDKTNNNEREGIKDVKKYLPVRLKIQMRPNIGLWLTQDYPLHEIKQKHGNIGQQ